MAGGDGASEDRDLPESLVDVAGRRIRDAILSGGLSPGAKIVEETLCADLGISRAPVREALRLLAQQGLVEHQPRRGTRNGLPATSCSSSSCGRCWRGSRWSRRSR